MLRQFDHVQVLACLNMIEQGKVSILPLQYRRLSGSNMFNQMYCSNKLTIGYGISSNKSHRVPGKGSLGGSEVGILLPAGYEGVEVHLWGSNKRDCRVHGCEWHITGTQVSHFGFSYSYWWQGSFLVIKEAQTCHIVDYPSLVCCNNAHHQRDHLVLLSSWQEFSSFGISDHTSLG